MNIFILDMNPTTAAKMHCDKHVVKMILESAQMLCTVANELGITTPYKSTHINHPCTKWVRESKQNYLWLVELFEALHDEWKFRYKHFEVNHTSYDKLKSMLNLELIANRLPDIGLTPFAQAMPEEYQDIDAVKAYRNYYINDKAHLLTYTRQAKPNWLKEN